MMGDPHAHALEYLVSGSNAPARGEPLINQPVHRRNRDREPAGMHINIDGTTRPRSDRNPLWRGAARWASAPAPPGQAWRWVKLYQFPESSRMTASTPYGRTAGSCRNSTPAADSAL